MKENLTSENAEEKFICYCIDVDRMYVGDYIDIFSECLATLTNKNWNVESELVETFKNMDEKTEQNHSSTTSKDISKNGYKSVTVMKWMVFDGYFKK